MLTFLSLYPGYGQNAPASASLEVFDVASGSFQTTYSPPAAVTSPTATTLPLPGQTGAPSFTPGSAEYPRPSHTQSSSPGGNGNGTDPGASPIPDGDSSSHGVVIALSTVFGVLGLAAGTAVGTWYLRRRRSQNSFHRLGASGETGEDDSPTSHHGPIPMAGHRDPAPPLLPVVRTMKDRLSRVVPGLHPTQTVDRRDMLADEDAGEFGGWYAVRRDPSGSASSRVSARRPASRKDG